ncbi:MAG: AtpZ/AtpI family protein [Actinobacteria bacterium]|nr:AtpZ/AtpI family protein [Actinomycetota bacterium]MCI0544044.1 AtpZ/AtpI family protein [Actinomycetota bacterium]MCI0678394.1 AtpZ/AtpI family protein [Actinomycetota bacterium]
MKTDSTTRQASTAINEGFIEGGSFLSSILSGTFLGMLADRWLGTEPWLVVIGAIVGSYSGFLKVWQYSKTIGADDES